jgi:hypothetical protein
MGLLDFHSNNQNFICCSFKTLAVGPREMLDPSSIFDLNGENLPDWYQIWPERKKNFFSLGSIELSGEIENLNLASRLFATPLTSSPRAAPSHGPSLFSAEKPTKKAPTGDDFINILRS